MFDSFFSAETVFDSVIFIFYSFLASGFSSTCSAYFSTAVVSVFSDTSFILSKSSGCVVDCLEAT